MRTRNFRSFAAVCSATVLLISCSTGKHAYQGPKRSLNELATISVVETDTSSRAFLGHHKEKPQITRVDGVQVGSHLTGFPKRIYVMPGQRVIDTEYKSSKSARGNMSPAVSGILGRQLSAAVASGINRAGDPKEPATIKQEVRANVQAGQSYELKAQSEDGMGAGVRVFLEESP